MTKMTRGFWLTAAASIAFAMGCGGGGGTTTDAGSGCSNDAACGTGKVCHPVLKSCVASCTVGADCPASAKKCARMDGTTATAAAPGFCQCETDQFCAAGTANQVCNQATLQCSDKCTSNLSCPTGSTCNATTGVCSAVASTGDAGSGDAGTTDAGTTTDAGVAACNLDNSNTQPNTCGYGSFCTGTKVCQAASNGGCSNVTTHAAGWTSNSTGPVIYDVVDETDVAADCTTGNAYTVTLWAYQTGGTFPAMKSDLPGFFYYNTSGNPTDIPTNLLRQSGYTLYQNGQVMSAKFTLCSTAASQSIQAGFGFTNGNGVCATLTR